MRVGVRKGEGEGEKEGEGVGVAAFETLGGGVPEESEEEGETGTGGSLTSAATELAASILMFFMLQLPGPLPTPSPPPTHPPAPVFSDSPSASGGLEQASVRTVTAWLGTGVPATGSSGTDSDRPVTNPSAHGDSLGGSATTRHGGVGGQGSGVRG